MQKILSALFVPIDRVFNRLYSSEYNPLYRSGTIAIGLLTIIIVSGTYLTFFYRLNEPYESILALQQNPWWGSWVRAVHRHASDAFIITVFAHLVRMYLQGKTWGPRTLAWISGVVLMLFMLISGWTGFIMVWDLEAQSLAIASAKIFDSLGIFSDSVGRSFNGVESTPPGSFFFLNLFIHIIIPLAMIFGLWIHTSKMARATWLPHKKLFRAMVALFVVFSVIWPAPLAEKANMLKAVGQHPLDWLYNFWVPFAHVHPLATFLTMAGVTIFLISIPWLTRPKAADRPAPSVNDDKHCQGCTQCVKDCPYEAIHMVPRTRGEGSAEVAEVKPWLCVSCGLCSASCVPFTMGPPGRKAGDQLTAARKFMAELRGQGTDIKNQVLIVGCGLQGSVLKNLQHFVAQNTGFQLYPAQCTGTVHATVYGQFAQNFQSVAIVNCPPRNCTNKDAAQLLTARLDGTLEPTFPREAQREKTHVLPTGDGEENTLFLNLLEIRDGQTKSPRYGRFAAGLAVAASFALLFALSQLGQVTTGTAKTDGFLRLSIRLSGQNERICHAATEQELNQKLSHMRTPEICEVRPITYKLNMSIGDSIQVQKEIKPGGLHHDRPIYVDEEFALPPGPHAVRIELAPTSENAPANAKKFFLEKTLHVQAERIVLIHQSADQTELLVKGDAP